MADEFSFFSNASSYAKLSSDDLKSLGKEAALDFLQEGIPLNDAVVKVAQRYPSISTHQVRRVVEFANQEAFANLFEKQAGDKNVDFDIADPAEVLHIINSGVRPVEVSAFPEEYASCPIKMASYDVESDLTLCREFGVEVTSPAMRKVASLPQLQPSPADRVLAKIASLNARSKKGYAGVITKMAFGEAAPMAGSNPNDGMSADEHHERMLALQREIELAKKREELAKIQQKANQDLGLAPPDQAAGDPNAAGAGQTGMPMEQMQQDPSQGMAPPMPAQTQPAPEQPMPFAGPMLSPPGGGVPKTAASLLSSALAHAKAGRPMSREVVEDLQKSASLEEIRSSVRSKETPYPSADPYRELVETRQKVAKLREEAVCAADTNKFMAKEAADLFYKEAEQFLWNGGRLGEVLHMMESISPSSEILKAASISLTKRLKDRGLDKVAARTDLIEYEMSNKGKHRVVDDSHPVAQSFGAFCKLASNQPVLETSRNELNLLSQKLDSALSEVWRFNASCQ